ncbi:MAG: prepilin-type N-terminal cleavage/methylation domain-containing protein [Opitutaceae bacterium]|jgi:general secretion pathway protein G|nr:prepilin-type N-terminal cleavage/methylation domain-containing protein [Opitutaceae bacterium]
MSKQTTRADAFTLIELLTVIAIIGILAAILIPTVGAVRKTANAAACVSNLHQIGVAFQLHAESSRGLLPKPQDQDASWPMSTWMYSLQPYLEQRKVGATPDNIALCFDGVFRCKGKPGWDLSKSDAYKISYGMSTLNADNLTGETSRNIARRLDALIIPALTMLAMDRATFTATGAEAGMPAYIITSHKIYRDAIGLWHKNKDNVLFADGHVEALPVNSLNYYLVKSADSEIKQW